MKYALSGYENINLATQIDMKISIWVAPQDLDSCPMEQKLFPGQEFFYFLKKALWNKSLPRRDARIEIRFLSLCGIETDRKRPSVKERRKYYGQQ